MGLDLASRFSIRFHFLDALVWAAGLTKRNDAARRSCGHLLPAEEAGDRGGHKFLRLADSFGQREAARERGGDGGAIGAAGAVGAYSGDKGGFVGVRGAVGQDEKVGGGGGAEVAAFDQEGDVVAGAEFESGVAHFAERK